jgi:hypothetical protein
MAQSVADKRAYNRKRSAVERKREPALHTARVLAARAKKVALIAAAKDIPCMDCGMRYPKYVMEFDHVRGVKVNNVGSMPSNSGAARILAEIAKCDVVCANCHRERTYGGSDV